MVAEALMTLPAFLILKEQPLSPRTQFNLQIFKNHHRELRMCYQAENDKEVLIPWEKDPIFRDWILLIENIDDDGDFVEAVQFVHHQLVKLAQYFENPFAFTTTKS